MKNLTKMVGLASIVLATSCATMTPAQKTALLGDVLTIGGSVVMPNSNNKEGDRARQILTTAGTVVTDQARMQHDLEYANAGKDQIIINNNTPDYQNQSQNSNQKNYSDNLTPEGFFMYKNFVDFNNDGKANRDEFIGLNEPVYTLRGLDCLRFSFYGGGNRAYNNQKINLQIYNLEDGKVINSFNDFYSESSDILDFVCERVFFPESGKYKAVLNVGNKKTFPLDFEVIK